LAAKVIGVSRNGQRRPRRPRIEIVSPTPSRDEAAAIAAAIERFLAETAPAPAASSPPRNPWQHAALHEGVGAKQAAVSPRGRASPWG
jgi:hypothetical protein